MLCEVWAVSSIQPIIPLENGNITYAIDGIMS